MGSAMLVAAAVACSSPGAQVGPSAPSATAATSEQEPTGNGPEPGTPGGWQGTITVHAVIDQSSDETTESGEGTYHTTLRSQSQHTADSTDEFALTGSDGDDVEFGVVDVELAGSAMNHGTSLERTVFTEDKHNALGCHYLEETGSETKGPWSQSSDGGGDMRFGDDGSYTINVRAGGLEESPLVPQRLWEGYTILEGAAIDCPPPGTSDIESTNGPLISWASSVASTVEGSVDPTNPGSVLEGTATFETDYLDATVTVTWHLVHEGPANLPNDGPQDPEY